MHVRTATHEDRTALPALHTAAVLEFGSSDYDTEDVGKWAKVDDRSLEDYETDSGDHFTVAIRSDTVAEFGHLVPNSGEIHAVYVHPDHAGRGVGSALLAELEGYARGCGLTELTLQSSLNAVGFYEGAGYDKIGEGESPGGLAVVEMRKHI